MEFFTLCFCQSRMVTVGLAPEALSSLCGCAWLVIPNEHFANSSQFNEFRFDLSPQYIATQYFRNFMRPVSSSSDHLFSEDGIGEWDCKPK